MRKEWTQEEESYLEKKYFSQPVKLTAKKLNRSVSSVKHKAVRMRLNHYTDSYSAKMVAKSFRVDFKVVKRWIIQFDLPCKEFRGNNQIRYIIDIEKFWKWAEKHKDIINWGKYERRTICPEPDWLQETISDYSTPKSRAKYTEQEIVLIKNLLHRGCNYREIAEKTGRTYNGINHLCRNIYYRNYTHH